MIETTDAVEFFRKHLKSDGGVESFIKHMMQKGQQNVHTPFTLCREIIGKLGEHCDLSDKKIGVLFNSEFLHVLVNDFGVKGSNITMFADDAVEYVFCRLQYGCTPGVNLFLIDIDKSVEEKELYTVHEGKWSDMKFDVIVGNPPYQAPAKENKPGGGCGSRNIIWDKFVILSLNLIKDNRFLCLVHPAKWRKPEDQLWAKMRNKQMHYIEIHNKVDGLRLFGATTRYDWYVLQNAIGDGRTIIKDEQGSTITLDIRDWGFLPNYDFDMVKSILAKDGEDICPILFSFSDHETRKTWMSETQDTKHPYPCVHWTGRTEPFVKYWYSAQQSKIMEKPKVIFGESDTIRNVIVDIKGELGVTPGAMGIAISSKTEGEQIKGALESDKFNEFLKACRWSNFRIDYRMFKYFRKDFWKEFV